MQRGREKGSVETPLPERPHRLDAGSLRRGGTPDDSRPPRAARRNPARPPKQPPYSLELRIVASRRARGSTSTAAQTRRRRTAGGEDAVEAGRHPPADGQTPETRGQGAAAAVLRRLRTRHGHGAPRNADGAMAAHRKTAFKVCSTSFQDHTKASGSSLLCEKV